MDIKTQALTLAALAILIGGGLGALKLGVDPTAAVALVGGLGTVAHRTQPPAGKP